MKLGCLSGAIRQAVLNVGKIEDFTSAGDLEFLKPWTISPTQQKVTFQTTEHDMREFINNCIGMSLKKIPQFVALPTCTISPSLPPSYEAVPQDIL